MSTENKYEFKGTKGDWEVVADYKISTIGGRPHAQAYCMAVGLQPNGRLIEDLEGKANAHLIAAAPDLLQACIGIANELHDTDARREPIIAAIHKALNIQP